MKGNDPTWSLFFPGILDLPQLLFSASKGNKPVWNGRVAEKRPISWHGLLHFFGTPKPQILLVTPKDPAQLMAIVLAGTGSTCFPPENGQLRHANEICQLLLGQVFLVSDCGQMWSHFLPLCQDYRQQYVLSSASLGREQAISVCPSIMPLLRSKNQIKFS
jgi:hypothetical protein